MKQVKIGLDESHINFLAVSYTHLDVYKRQGQSPTLSAYAAYNFEGRDFPLDEGWNYGLSLSCLLYTSRCV